MLLQASKMPKIPVPSLNNYFCPVKAIVNNKEFLIKEKAGRYFSFDVNGKPIELEGYVNHNGIFCFLYRNRSYEAEFISYDENDKVAVIKLNNTRFEVKLKDETDILLEQLGITGKSHKAEHIKAPMPGLVLSVEVKKGDKVNKGDRLLVLEAMKMENLIKAQSQGRVKKIHVSKGAKVEKNQPLIELE